MKGLRSIFKFNRLMAFVMVFSILAALFIVPTPVHAASRDPYGFTYDETFSGKTIYQYHSYSLKDDNFKVREFYSKGTYVYRSSDKQLVLNNTTASGSKFNGFDDEGNFYCICSDTSLVKTDINNKSKIVLEKGAKSLNYNSDDLVTTVTTESGRLYINTLNPAPDVDDGDDYDYTPPSRPSNRVDIYTNSAGELVYEAYKESRLLTQIVISANGKNVLNSTDKVRLSDTLKGAKFLGFDTKYNVYLWEPNSLYRFKAGHWYSAEKMQLSGSYKSFKKDTNGFISMVVTSNGSYTIQQLTTSKKWKASKTYVVQKSGYATLYIKGSTASHTLTLKSNSLKLDGKKIASNVRKYAFVSGTKLIYMKGSNVFVAALKSPKKAIKLFKNGKNFKKNSNGLVKQVVTTKGIKNVK